MKIFLDANIILDLIDKDRGNFDATKNRIQSYILKDYELYTSCDIFTTIYYVASKKIDFEVIILELERIVTFVQIIPIDITIITHALEIAKNENHKDLEDILQYLCAKIQNCGLIVSNDKNFYSKDINIERIDILLEI
jgi:predicted nucleic acid-binding protein